MWSKRRHSFYETNEAAVYSPLVRSRIKTVAIKSFPSCSNPPWLSRLQVKARAIKRPNSAMTLSSEVQVSAVVLAVFCSLCRSAAGEDLRAAPPELRLFRSSGESRLCVGFIFFPSIYLFIPAPRQRIARVVGARLQLHPPRVATCWTVYFGLAECVAKLKPPTWCVRWLSPAKKATTRLYETSNACCCACTACKNKDN